LAHPGADSRRNVAHGKIPASSRLEAAPLASADEWLRFYERFWSEQLNALDAILLAEDAVGAVSAAKKGAKS
jgi:hypothetical protein